MTTRRALVTGANRGIGEAVTRELGRAGWAVVAACRREDDAKAAAEALKRDGVDATPLSFDLGDPKAVAKACAWLADERIDALVNNAGIYPQGGALEVDEAEVRASLEVHLFAPLALCRAVVPGMKKRRFGRIVNVSSGYGSFGEGLEGPAAYCLGKVALDALTVKLAQELPDSIKVNAVCPGWVQTRMGGAGADVPVEVAGKHVAHWVLVGDDGPTGGFFREREKVPW